MLQFLRDNIFIFKINSPCLVPIYGIYIPIEKSERPFGIATHYIPYGSLSDLLNRNFSRLITSTNRLIIAFGLSIAMKVLAENGIHSMSIKASNIFMNPDLGPQLSD